MPLGLDHVPGRFLVHHHLPHHRKTLLTKTALRHHIVAARHRALRWIGHDEKVGRKVLKSNVRGDGGGSGHAVAPLSKAGAGGAGAGRLEKRDSFIRHAGRECWVRWQDQPARPAAPARQGGAWTAGVGSGQRTGASKRPITQARAYPPRRAKTN